MSAGAIAGGVAGGVIGFFVGGPAGAAIGFGIGLSVGGMLDPPKGPSQPGPQLNDKNFQTAKYGDLLPRFYGTIAVGGNVTWIEGGKLKVTLRKKKSGGKGGGSAKAAPVAYYSATFFLSIGLGPIAGVRRIWCSDKLIYNAGSDDLETIIASNQAATGFRVYLGTDDQLPDPRYEAEKGVGNALAHRGEVYIAFYDFQLGDFGNSLQGAQFKVEVVTSASSSFELIQQYTIPYAPEAGDVGVFPSQAYTCTQEKVVIYAPQWSNSGSFPRDANWIVYEVYTSGLKRIYTLTELGVVAGDIPPNGDSDVDGEHWKNSQQFFPGVSLSFNDGYMQRRGDLYVGLSGTTTHTLHARSGAAAFSAGSTAQCFAIANGLIYAFSSGGVQVFDSQCTLLSTHPLTLPTMEYPRARAEFVDGAFLVFTGSVTPRIYRISAALDAVELVANVPLAPPNSGYAISVNLSAGVLVRTVSDYTSRQHYVQWYNLRAFDQAPVPLASVVEAEVELSSLLTASDIDTSLLTAQVRGYRVSGGSIRSALEPLQGAFPFDIIQSGYQLKCVPRGLASVMTIPWQDLGASDGDSPGDLLQESREMDSQLPARTSIKYLDAAREYAVAEQSAARDNTPAINRVDRELPLVLTADEAAKVADVLQNLPWRERTPAKFSLPPIYLALEPADVVTIEAPWATYELRLTEGNYTPSGRGEWDAKPNQAALYTSNAKGAEGVPPSGLIPLPGPSVFVAADIPVVDDTLQDAPGFVGVMAGPMPGWPGGLALRSIDGGQTWTDVQAYAGQGTFGYARGTLPVSDCTLIDQRTLTVDLVAGELESITRDQMLAGLHYVAYGINGRWEILRFQNAVLQADGSHLVSGFVRGERGTEWATGLHQPGDYFILLDDPDNAFIGLAIGSLGVPSLYRGVTSGASIDSAADVPFTYAGVNLECLSPVYAKGARDGSGNFSGSFTRRSRLSSSWWSNGVEAPLGETTQAYEIDVMSGSTVKRTLTASTPAFSYSAANQTTDFGTPQAALTFRIYQLSSVVGRGYPLEVTL